MHNYGPERPRSKFTVVGCGIESLNILCSSKFTCTKCVIELNTTADALKTRSEIVVLLPGHPKMQNK